MTSALSCLYCNRVFTPGVFWPGANICRALFLLPAIASRPGLSAWELSQATGMTYGDVTGGLQKARDRGAVTFSEQARDQGGVRYRYYVADDWEQTTADWHEAVDKLNAPRPVYGGGWRGNGLRLP